MQKMNEWINLHKEKIEEAFEQKIPEERLVFFIAYDSIEEIENDLPGLVDLSKPWLKKVSDKWVVQMA